MAELIDNTQRKPTQNQKSTPTKSKDSGSKKAPPKEGDPSFTIRESRVLLAMRLMLLVFLALIVLSASVGLSASAGSVLGMGDIVVINVVLFLLLAIFTGVIGLFVVLKWNSEFYKVTPDGVIEYSGIISKREQRFACSFVEGMTVKQSILGRFFGYGTVVIYDPSQKQKIYLSDIPHPRKNGDRITQMMKKEDAQDKSVPVQPSPDPDPEIA